MKRCPLAVLLALSAACMPPKLSADSSTSSDDDADDDAQTETEGEPEPGDGDGDPTTTGDGDGDAQETTLTFVPDEDWSTIGCECDPFAQDCPEGEKCVGYASAGGVWYDANKCVPITGSQTAGEVCSYGGLVEATDDCDEDSYCFDAQPNDNGLTGTCRAFCGGTADDPLCAEDHQCVLTGEGSVNVCVPFCDPLLQDCAEGSACQWIWQSFTCLSAPDPVGLGQPCEAFNACAAGLFCATADVLPACDGDACCTAYCEIGSPDDPCAELPGSTCAPFFDEAPPGLENLGVCRLV